MSRFSSGSRFILAVTVALGLSAPVHASGPHIHGAAMLEIAIDGSGVSVSLYSPLDNLVGFERAPRDEKERQAVKSTASRLHQAESLFIFTPQAQCRLETAALKAPLLPPELLIPSQASGKMDDQRTVSPAQPENKVRENKSQTDSSTASPHGHDEHAELEAAWSFKCANPQALRDADVRLFQAFPGLRRLDAVIASPRGQRSDRLSPASSQLKW